MLEISEIRVDAAEEPEVFVYWGWWKLIRGHSWEWREAPFISGETFKIPKNAVSLCLIFKKVGDE